MQAMAEWDDVSRLALALPETGEQPLHGWRTWRVRGKLFVWERPLSAKDIRDLGGEAPSGPILGARVEDQGAKESYLQRDRGVYFTIPHFTGYDAVLVRLERIAANELAELVEDAWLCRAPKRVLTAYLAEHG
jgi:hypothetical protein